jgi:hypothetical protein
MNSKWHVERVTNAGGMTRYLASVCYNDEYCRTFVLTTNQDPPAINPDDQEISRRPGEHGWLLHRYSWYTLAVAPPGNIGITATEQMLRAGLAGENNVRYGQVSQYHAAAGFESEDFFNDDLLFITREESDVGRWDSMNMYNMPLDRELSDAEVVAAIEAQIEEKEAPAAPGRPRGKGGSAGTLPPTSLFDAPSQFPFR